ncbi:MAG TPA: TlpA disulfide reductase family protein [Polyangiaceae bacterium]
MTQGRSEVVQATGTMATAAPSASASAHPTAPSGPHVICTGDQPARTLPKGTLPHVEATGAPSAGDHVPAGDGQWTWINFFAGWCGPCKEEMPRLKGWETKLAQEGAPTHFVFISVDDDQRQLVSMLNSQPPNGVKSALWLNDNVRDGWLAAMKLKNPPDLPEQALVDPTGKVKCVIEGAVDDADYAQVKAIVSKR